MKLLTRDAESLTFELDRRERELLAFLLGRYPALDPSYHQSAAPNDRDALAEAQQMLTESMTAEQQENRRRAAAFVRTRLTVPAPPAPGSPAPSRLSLRITLTEVDWLLRVVNDVRVGCWVRLGCPEEDALRAPMLAARNVTDYTAMELGGLVQSLLLAALEA